ncbi:MAG TPA: FlgD immunoglobulin-like domain containing protein [Gaiellales bacterium]|nr:FlgD immunoglobulin-like domain containing protein [Gaiellales bacterium]
MKTKPCSTSSRRTGCGLLLVAAVAAVAALACGSEAFAQLPLPLPIPPPNLSLGPPALPTIPSLPQVLPGNAPGPSSSAQLPMTSAQLDAKLLVVSADGTEPVLGMIRQVLDYEGVPYTLYVASQTPGGFTPTMLSDGNAHAYYQGVILTTGTLAYLNGTTWTSAFNSTEWQTLWDYQAKYRVRTAIAYAYPTPDLGYGPATGMDATTAPISAQLTSSGQSAFPYINAANPLVITKAWVYLAQAAGGGTDVLLTDAQNHALALVKSYPDGRQVLSMTFDGNFFLVHSLALAHGLLSWVTGGLFLGERHVYMTPQVDDIFIDDDIYGGTPYRITGPDWTACTAWQTQKQLQAQTADLRLHMAFNGQGTTGVYFLDTLTPAAQLTSSQFPWINHTYSHANLDSVSYDVAYQEITQNDAIATSMGFADYDPRALVTPDISGLSSPTAMSAAYDAGVRYLVTDTSRPGMNNPTPQAGITNPLQPGILMVPRRPVNLFYNVSTPTEWTNEYNYLYHSFWGRDLTYDEILDKESDVLLQYLLRGEIDPWMFHQSNLRAYDGLHDLLGDLLDRTLGKYEAIYNLPLRNLELIRLGQWTQNRMDYDAAGVQCSFVPSQGAITLTATRPAVVAVTGLCSDSAETYGGQCITHVALSPGQTVTMRTGPVVAGTLRPAVPAKLSLHQNSPNPFHSSTQIAFDLPRAGAVSLKVFDAGGRLVRVIADGSLPAGSHVLSWDGRDERGSVAATGVYFYELRAPAGTSRRRMVLIR